MQFTPRNNVIYTFVICAYPLYNCLASEKILQKAKVTWL